MCDLRLSNKGCNKMIDRKVFPYSILSISNTPFNHFLLAHSGIKERRFVGNTWGICPRGTFQTGKVAFSFCVPGEGRRGNYNFPLRWIPVPHDLRGNGKYLMYKHCRLSRDKPLKVTYRGLQTNGFVFWRLIPIRL